ncbi:hypothetical protein HYC85_001574 [Camellia sinensis]|uniref:Ubiquitin carboxyl-terminal hydrolase n=1 Tax=Camellia sinensis TaxID=4442 RepID=A0A7J7I6D3_CAMSI|nr:hypothetical protein HYC85_001574 [Camellia sinensis]
MKIEGNLDIIALIHKFKYGFRTLSNVKWVSASGFHISVAGLLGVAGLVLAVRDGKIRNFNCLPWSSDRDTSLENKWMVPGLQNLGNNCFLNVILQALASCSCFQSFLRKTEEEFESLLGEEWVESLPLTVALASLMEGSVLVTEFWNMLAIIVTSVFVLTMLIFKLCNVRHGRMVLSPWKLMLVMNHYISNFNLASQQDAEEAFFHILSSLREEVSNCYVPICSSLADVSAIRNCRILHPERGVDQNEQERWQRSFLGPFDGILGSNLTCESCSSLWIFNFFIACIFRPCLVTVMPRCSLEDCLKQFFVAERLENYCCSHCWHVAAMKYLSSMAENEILENLGGVVSKKVLVTAKIFRFLKHCHGQTILCIHLQRVSVNEFGELVKLQGHVSFPLILNIYPFMKSGVGTKNWEENLQSLQHQPYHNHFRLQLDTSMVNGIYGQMGKNIYSKAAIPEKLGQSAFELSVYTHGQAFQGESNVPQSGGCSDIMVGDITMQSDNKVDGNCHLAPSRHYIYCLVSVVQHFGRAAGGHYTVYRRVRAKNDGGGDVHWFCISDSEVYSVSERDVLAAEASVLFYEKISEHPEICGP